MNQPAGYDFSVHVETRYLPDRSNPAENQHVFAYTITISNRGQHGATLISRHWLINSGGEKTQEVRGDGVVGQQPHIEPGDSFQYSSGTVIESTVGTMFGSYQMQTASGDMFDLEIPAFSLALPGAIH